MPTYDYGCPACGHVFEVREKMSDDAPKTCAKCGKKKARRKISATAGIIFKGSGFYVTDKGNGRPPAAGDPKKKTARKTTDKTEKTDKTGKTEKAEKTETKSDSKTEKK